MKKYLLFFVSLCISTVGFGQLLDGSFEAGAGMGQWTEASVAFGTPLCNLATCGDCGGDCASSTGDWYAWFGGTGGGAEVGSVSQDIVIPVGTTAEVEMMVDIANPGEGVAGDNLIVYMDGNILSTITALDSASYDGYTLLSIDVSSYLGGTHTLLIEGNEVGTSVFNMLVDDVELIVDGLIFASIFDHVDGQNGVTVYPNPADESINIEFGAAQGDVSVRLANMNGQIVSTESLSQVANRSFQFNTADLPNGVYMVTINSEGTQISRRVVVAH